MAETTSDINNKTGEQLKSETARQQLEWAKAKNEARQKLKDTIGDDETYESIVNSADQFQTAFLTQAAELKRRGGDPKDFAELIRAASNGYFGHLTSENLKPEVAHTALGGFLAAVSLKREQSSPSGITSLEDRAKGMVTLLTQKFNIKPDGK